MRATWLMDAPSAEPRMPRGAIGGPAYFASKRRAGISGYAMTTEPTLSCDGLAQAETRQAFQAAQLLAQRAALIGTAKHLRNQSRCKEASLATAELRAVVNACLSMGET